MGQGDNIEAHLARGTQGALQRSVKVLEAVTLGADRELPRLCERRNAVNHALGL